MHFHNRNLAFAVMVIACTLTLSKREGRAGEESMQVLEKIRSYDSVYMAALTARGTVLHPPPFNALYLPTFVRDWTATRKGDRFALIESTPKIVVPFSDKDTFGLDDKGRSPPGVAYDANGKMVMSILSGIVVSLEEDRSATNNISTILSIAKTGEVLSRKDSRTVLYDQANARHLTVNARATMWVLGRGFSAYIREITTVTKIFDGQLVLTAVGGFVPADQAQASTSDGRWVLTVDPESQYIVRSAKLYMPADAEIASVDVSNDEIKNQGACIYPARGRCALFRAEPRTYTIEDVTLATDESTFSEARRLTDAVSEPRTSVVDYRETPPKSTFIDERGIGKPFIGTLQQTPEGYSALFVVLLINGVAMALILAWLTLRRIRSR